MTSDKVEDNDFDDPNFIPGTPPSKKFKPTSVLFGLNIFANTSDILAPDSDDESF